LKEDFNKALQATKEKAESEEDKKYYEEFNDLLTSNIPKQTGEFRIKFKEASFDLINTDARNNDSFTNIRNSRITSYDQLVMGGNFISSLEYQYNKFNWETGLTLKYQQVRIFTAEQTIKQDPIDKIYTDTEFSYNLFTFKNFSLASGVSPFLNFSYETEFTKQEDLERIKLFDVIIGPKFYSGKFFDFFKLGAIIETDFAGSPDTEYGIYSKIELTKRLINSAMWQSEMTLKYFPPMDSDSDDDLDIDLNIVNKLLIPVFSDISIGPLADVLLYRGKTETTNSFGASIMLGITLSYSKIWKPRYSKLF
jgi:hypothetical protein